MNIIPSKKIRHGFIWVLIFLAFGKFAGAIKEMVLASRYGVGETIDTYSFIVNILAIPANVLLSAFTLLLIPIIARLRRDNPDELVAFGRELFGLIGGVAFVSLLFGYFFLPYLFVSGAINISGLSVGRVQQYVTQLVLLLPLGILISFFSAWAMSIGGYKNTVLEVMPPILIVITCLNPTPMIPEPLIFGTIVGFIFQLLGLAWILRNSNELFFPSLSIRAKTWKEFGSGMGILLVGQIFASFVSVVDQFFAAQLVVGSISILNYSNRVLALLIGLLSIAISRSTLPVFSEVYAAGDRKNLAKLTRRWLFITFVFGTGLTLLAWITSPILVTMLFSRGAFTANDALSVSSLLRYSILQVPFYLVGMVYISFFSIIKAFKIIAISGFLNLIVKLIFASFLIKMYGLHGLVFSTVLMYALLIAFFQINMRLLIRDS